MDCSTPDVPVHHQLPEVTWSEVAQSCLTLGDPMDYIPPGSSVDGILHERILEWVATSLSGGFSWPRDRTPISHLAGRCFNLWATKRQWCHLTISSCLIHFSSCLQSFSASMSQFFTSNGQSGVSASGSVLPTNIQGWFPLGWTGWISLKSKGLSRVFSNTTVKSINSSVLSCLYSPTLHSWPLEKP